MRILGAVIFSSITTVALGVVSSVNLDAPGALEALKRDRPTHYAKVVEAVDRVQAVPYSENAARDLLLRIPETDPNGRGVETSFPAKTRLTVPIEDTNYLITVLYVKNPPTGIPAK